MELGEPFKRGMNIQPGEEGTFIVHVMVLDGIKGVKAAQFGFTCIDDLLIWMARHGSPKQPGNAQSDAVHGGNGVEWTTVEDGKLVRKHILYPDLMDAKRTTAGKTLAERVEAMGSRPVSDPAA